MSVCVYLYFGDYLHLGRNTYVCFHAKVKSLVLTCVHVCFCVSVCVCVCCSQRAAEHMIIDDDSYRPLLILYAEEEDKKGGGRGGGRRREIGVGDVFGKLCWGVGSDGALCVCVCSCTQERLIPPTDP